MHNDTSITTRTYKPSFAKVCSFESNGVALNLFDPGIAGTNGIYTHVLSEGNVDLFGQEGEQQRAKKIVSCWNSTTSGGYNLGAMFILVARPDQSVMLCVSQEVIVIIARHADCGGVRGDIGSMRGATGIQKNVDMSYFGRVKKGWRMGGESVDTMLTQCMYVDTMWTQEGYWRLWIHLGRQGGC